MKGAILFFTALSMLLVFGGTAAAQENIIILVSDNPADLAVAHSFAEKINVSLVVTPWGTLSDEAVQKIDASAAVTVYVVGGAVAVPDVEVKVKIQVKRFAGEDRYHTSALIAEEWGTSGEVVVAVGDDEQGIQDARAMSKAKGVPVLFVKPDSVPDSVANAMGKLKSKTSIVMPTPNMDTARIKTRIKEMGVEEVSETQIDFRDRASKAIELAEVAIALAEENTTEVADGRSLAAARLVINAKKHLEKAKTAFDAGSYGEAFGLATAAKAQADSSVKISQGVVVGTFKQDVSVAGEEVKVRGLAKVKAEIDVEAAKHGIKIAKPESIPAEPLAKEGDVTKRGAGAGR